MKRRPGGVKGKTQRLEGTNPPLIESSGVKITHASVDRGIHRSTLFIQLEHDGTQTNRVLRNAATWVIEALKMTSTTTKAPTAKFKIGDIVPFAPGTPGKTVEAFSIRVPSKLWPNTDALNRATLIAGRLALTGRNPRESEEGTGTYTKLLVQDLPRAQDGHEDALVEANTSVWVALLAKEVGLDSAALEHCEDSDSVIAKYTLEWVRQRTRWAGWETPADRGGVCLASYDAQEQETRTVWTMRQRKGGIFDKAQAEKLMALLGGDDPGTARTEER